MRDRCCIPLQAPKLVLRGKKQVSLWLKCLEDHSGDAHVALAVWPSHWAGALQAKNAAKAARKAATEAAKKPVAAKAVAATKLADDDGNIASDGLVPAISGANAAMAMETIAMFVAPVWVDEWLCDEVTFQRHCRFICSAHKLWMSVSQRQCFLFVFCVTSKRLAKFCPGFSRGFPVL
jgi:hypothetical protein